MSYNFFFFPLWRYCKDSKNIKRRHEGHSAIKRWLESGYGTSTQHVWSISYIFIGLICNEDSTCVIVAIATVALWGTYCITLVLHLFTGKRSNFIYYLYDSCFFRHFISTLRYNTVTSLSHSSLNVACMISD